MSERRACRVIGCDRMTVRYRSRRPDDPGVARAARGAGEGAPAVRLSAPADLSAPGGLRREPQTAFPHLPRGTPHGAQKRRPQKGSGHQDANARCRRCRTIAGRWTSSPISSSAGAASASWRSIDDCTRECLAAVADVSLSGRRVARELDLLIAARGKPKIDHQRQRHGTNQQRDPRPGLPKQGRLALHRIRASRCRTPSSKASMAGLRDEFLNETLFTSLMQARLALEEWRRDYNTVRPHSRHRLADAGRLCRAILTATGPRRCAPRGLRALARCSDCA